MQIPLPIQKAIDETLNCFQCSDIDDHNFAFNKCLTASINLALELKKIDSDVSILRLSGWQGGLLEPHHGWKNIKPFFYTHYVVRYKTRIIDLTFRQFDRDSPFPKINTIEDITRDWIECETVLEKQWKK